MSFAKGGLANAWGAGVFRFDAQDLADFPFPASTLDPYYDEITREIGVSGTADDLAPFFGSAEGLQPPLPLEWAPERLLRAYGRRRDFFRSRGIHLGRPRLAVLTRPLGHRPAYRGEGMEFFRCADRAVYSPAQTIDQLREAGRLRYTPGHLAQSFEERHG